VLNWIAVDIRYSEGQQRNRIVQGCAPQGVAGSGHILASDESFVENGLF